jgi:branched-chain amino acid transport system substrate-binding protein
MPETLAGGSSMMLRSLAVAALAVAVAAFPYASAAQAPATLHVPVIISLTGLAAFIGKGEQQDLQRIEEIVNKQGGINHRRVQFDIADDASNPQTAVQLANQIIAQKAPVMIGAGLTQDCNAMAPLIRDRGPVEYCLSPGINPAAGGFIFSSSVSLRDCALVAIRYFRERGLTRLAILSSTDATGQEIDQDYDLAKALPENRQIQFVAREHFNLNDVSVGAQIARIKAANPQALLTWTVGPAFGTELHGISDGGLDVPVLGSNGDMVYGQLRQYKGFMPKELIFNGVLASSRDSLGSGPITAAQNVYFNAFKAAGIQPDFPNTLAWDPALIVLDAYRHLGFNATAQQFRAYMNGLHGWVGINGVYDFRDGTQHGIGQNAVIMSRWDPAREEFFPVSKRAGHPR